MLLFLPVISNDLSELEEDYILSTNTILDNIMYCDKYRKKLELAEAIRTAYGRVGKLGLQEMEEFRNWVKYILLSVCGNKEAVVEEILSWAGNGEDERVCRELAGEQTSALLKM